MKSAPVQHHRNWPLCSATAIGPHFLTPPCPAPQPRHPGPRSLVMGTRSGDLDPAIPLHLMRTLGLSAAEMDGVLNKKSGLLGLCGNNDLRNVIERRAKGDHEAALAMDVFIYRVRKYIGAYTMALGGHVDAIVFSAGEAWAGVEAGAGVR
jgi:butyrate kinase